MINNIDLTELPGKNWFPRCDDVSSYMLHKRLFLTDKSLLSLARGKKLSPFLLGYVICLKVIRREIVIKKIFKENKEELSILVYKADCIH
jgi:hypothetical protein